MKLWAYVFGTRPTPVAPSLRDRLCSPNGFEREAAVLEAGRLADASVLPMLLVRANDWVPQVRSAARRALRSFLQPAVLPHWCDALDDVVALERAGRNDHEPLLEEIRAFLRRTDCLPAVRQAVQHGPEQLRRFAFDLEWSSATASQRAALLRRGLTGTDRLVARIAVSLLQQLSGSQDQVGLAQAGCSSRFAPVRAQSLRILLAAGDPSASDWAFSLCLDRSASVRAVAWQHLRRTDRVSNAIQAAATQFQDAPNVSDRCAALDFLATATSEQAQSACREALNSSHPRLRALALAALLSRTTGPVQEELLLRGLRDASSKVQLIALRAVMRGALPPPSEPVLEAAKRHGTVASLRRAFAVLSRTPPWERLLQILRCMEVELPEGCAAVCLDALADWERDARNVFLPLRQPLRSDVESLWRRVAPKVTGSLQRRVSLRIAD